MIKNSAILLLLFFVAAASCAQAQFLPESITSPPPSRPLSPPPSPKVQASSVGFTNFNYPTGFIIENPVHIVYQNAGRVTAIHDRVADAQGYGLEAAYGQDLMAFSVEFYKNDCLGCEGLFQIDAGITLGETGIGFKIGEDIRSAGLLFNVQGLHQFGAVYEVNELGGSGNRINAYSLGYYFVDTSFIFRLDAAKQEFENPVINDNLVVLTPGVFFLVQNHLQLSLSDRIRFEGGRKVDDDIWAGLGWGTSWIHGAVYSNFDNASSAALSFYF